MKVLLALCIGLFIFAGLVGGPVAAATPSPTPTLPPIQPSATPGMMFFRITPTPLPTSNATLIPLDISGRPEQMADTAINIYRYFDSDGIISAVLFIGLLAYIVGSMVRMINSATQDKS